MSTIVYIILGGVAGWLASIIMGNNKDQGIIGNIIAGCVGGYIGGWVMSFFGYGGITDFSWYSLFVAVIGAVIFIRIKMFFF